MPRHLMTVALLAAGLALASSPMSAQVQPLPEQHRFELTPFAGYQWGGSFETDAFDVVPAGELQLDDAWSWGVVLSFVARRGSALELIYLRQDTDVGFDPVGAPAEIPLGGFANNYIQIGGRQEFGHSPRLRPFVSGSLGINILDPKVQGFGTSTRFAWSLGAGAIFMGSGRIGFRTDIRWWLTPVPSGDYGTWCDFYGCFVVEGTEWLSQGQVSGGIIFAF